MTQDFSEKWDAFLDAYAKLKAQTLAYDSLLEETISNLAKSKRQEFEERQQTLREGVLDG